MGIPGHKKIDGLTATEGYNKGVVLYDIRKYEEAIDCYNHALKWGGKDNVSVTLAENRGD